MSDPGDEHADPTDMGTHRDWEQGALFVGDNDHGDTHPVQTPVDQFNALEDTREFLKKVVEDRYVSEGIRNEAIELVAKFPTTWDTGWLITRATKWTQYVQLSDDPKLVELHRSPVDYLPAVGGWVFWFEDWAIHSKPFATCKEATTALEAYAKTLED